jgi:type I restriction enzyme S subunit
MSFPRYPKYKDSGVDWIGEVPEHWNVVGLKTSFRLVGGSTPKSEVASFWDGDIPWATPGDLSKLQSIHIEDTERKITAAGLASCGTSLVPAGAIILSTRAPIGSLAITERAMCTNQGCKSLVPSGRADTRYFAHLLSVSTAELNQRGRGTTFLELSADALGAFKTPTPPLTEQALIATFLDRETAKIDALVEEQRRLMELLKEKRQAVISHAVTKGLNPHAPMKPSGIAWLGDVPAHWAIERLKNIAARLQGRLIVQPQLYFADEGVPIVFGYNIKNGVIDEAGLSRIDYETDRKHAHAKARAGDLFTVRLGDPGKTVVVPRSLDGCHFASIMWIHQSERFHSEWLSHCMNSAVVQRQIEAVNYGAAQTQFNIRDAVDFRLPVPPLEEQREIVATIDRQLAGLDTLSAEAQRAIDLLQERRTALISAAVTGQIDVRGIVETVAA